MKYSITGEVILTVEELLIDIDDAPFSEEHLREVATNTLREKLTMLNILGQSSYDEGAIDDVEVINITNWNRL